MQLLKRNKSTIQYKNYNGNASMISDGEYFTGERSVGYSEFKTLKAYITANKGNAEIEMFGTTLEYDNVIYAELPCDITETSLLWVHAGSSSANDYIVKKVATSLNHKAIAIQEVR